MSSKKELNYTDENSFGLKYFRMFIFTSPLKDFRNYLNGLDRIFEELEKTKLPTANEYQKEISKEMRKQTTKSSFFTLVSFGLLYKWKSLSWINKIFFAGVLACSFNYIFSLQMKENILNYLIESQTHYGQEARILTKYLIPNHNRILAIQRNIEYFRDYIVSKKARINAHKTNVEKMLMKEKELDSVFIDEVLVELEKQEKEENDGNEGNERKPGKEQNI